MATVPSTEARQIWDICQDVGANIYGMKAPNGRYAHMAATLLFGTAAHESGGFVWRRQTIFRDLGKFSNLQGGHGFWQIEGGSVNDSLLMLSRNKDLGDRAARWLFRDKLAQWAWAEIPVRAVLREMLFDDRIGCLFARLHYFRVATPIPEPIEQQANYWKAWYNTAFGKGKPEQYMRAWHAHCASIV